MRKQNNPLREKLDAFSYEYDPTAWQAMEKKLDAQEKPKAVWWRLSPLLALLLLGVLGGTAYLILTDSSEMTVRQSEEKTISQIQEAPTLKKAGIANTEKQSAISSPSTSSSKDGSSLQRTSSFTSGSLNTPQNMASTDQPDAGSSATASIAQQSEVQPDQLAQFSTLAYAFEAANALLPGTPKKVPIIAIKKEEMPKKKRQVVLFEPEGDKFSPIPDNWGIKFGANLATVGPQDPGLEEEQKSFFNDALLGMYFTYNLPGPFKLQIEPTYRAVYNYNIVHQDTVHRFGLVHEMETSVGSLTFFELQLMGHLRYTRRSSFELGASISKIQISGYSYTSHTPSGMPPGVSFEEPPRFGIRPFTYSAIVGYEYKLSGRFRFSARYQFGLRDLSDPGLYESKQKHRGSDLQLSLKFQFNKPPKREIW